MKKRNISIFPVLVFLFLPYIHIVCNNPGISGSETTNGLIIAVVNDTIKGRTVPGNAVMCFSTSYNPNSKTGYSDTVIADLQGFFTFSNLEKVTYNVFTYSQNGDYAAIVQDLGCESPKSDTSVNFDRSFTITGRTLGDSGALRGTKVYLEGTPFIVNSDTSGTFTIANVPGGHFLVESVFSQRWNNPKGTLTASQYIEISEKSHGTKIVVILNLK